MSIPAVGDKLKKAHEHRAPIVGNVLAVATSTTHSETQIPASFFGVESTWCADGGAIYVLFGAAPVADKTDVSGNGRCALLPAGVPVQIFIEASDGIVSVSAQASTGTPTLRAWISSH